MVFGYNCCVDNRWCLDISVVWKPSGVWTSVVCRNQVVYRNQVVCRNQVVYRNQVVWTNQAVCRNQAADYAVSSEGTVLEDLEGIYWEELY